VKAREIVDYIQILLEPDEEIDKDRLEKMFNALRVLHKERDVK